MCAYDSYWAITVSLAIEQSSSEADNCLASRLQPLVINTNIGTVHVAYM